ncbi:MAG TPA: hypothetical protein PK822_08870 [Bacillota bacterium]|nr:hypothetical protein [Bacillota bacterium]
MTAEGLKFAGTTVEIDTTPVAKVTAFNRALTIGEAEVTGSEDLVEGGDIVAQKFVSTQVGETATVEGIALPGDAGQSELYEAASTGATVALKHTRPDGSGVTLTGFFTAYNENGGLSGGVYTWSGTFRVNGKTPIVPAG